MLSMKHSLVLTLLCKVPIVTSLLCYSCSGKKGQCQVSSDPGSEKDCPSIQALIRPSVLITLDAKWKNISRNRNEKTITKALLTTFSELYATIPSLAILDHVEDIPDSPTFEDCVNTAGEVWKGIDSKCGELGCEYDKKLEEDNSALEKHWENIASKKNALSIRSALQASFNNLQDFLPSPNNTEPVFNVSEDTTKDEIANTTDAILTALNTDCIDDLCPYSDDLKTSAMDLLDSKWTEINSKRNAESIKEILQNSISDIKSNLPTPEFGARTSNITEGTSLDDLKVIIDGFWTDLNEHCNDNDCKLAGDIKGDATTKLESDFNALEEKTSASITLVLQEVFNNMVVSYKTHYETIANNAVTSATVSDTTTYDELMQIVGELLGDISAECLNSNCSFTVPVNDSIVSSIGMGWKNISPKKHEINNVWKNVQDDIKNKFYAYHSTIATDALTPEALEIADNTTYEDLQNVTEAVLGKINAACKDASCTYSEALKSQVISTFDTRWADLAMNKNDMHMVLNLAFGEAYRHLQTSESSPVTKHAASVTAKMTFEQLVNVSDEALTELIGGGPENGCTYLEKETDRGRKYFRNCLYHQKLALSDLQKAKIQLKKTLDPNNATICKDDLCNKKGLFTCMVCKGPNNICKLGEVGESKACSSEELYCIKELSGDSSNRELVARKCGTEFDREATCGSSGENIGIAAKGLVRCCSNREVSDCNPASRCVPFCEIFFILFLLVFSRIDRA